MKKIIMYLAVISITACNNSNNPAKKSNTKTTDSTATNTQVAPISEANANPLNETFSAYLQIKNGLANDNGADAASGGKAFLDAIGKVDKTKFTADQNKTYSDIVDDAKEMAEHISKNADKLEHQREHFDMLSNDVYDLVKTFGAGQSLYKDFCPMYNDKKGAIWLSESKEIKNPYFGKKMLTCGIVKEELK